jgi:Cd2+/Zn2+-exporting ATPase
MEKYRLKNIDCANCALKIENAVKRLESTKEISVDFATLTMLVDTNNIDEALKEIKRVEPGVGIISDTMEEEENFKNEKAKLIIGIVLLILAVIISIVMKNKVISNVLYVLSYIVVGQKVVIGAIRNIMKGNLFDELFLMSFATIAAFFIGAFSEAAGVMIFYSVGELLQGMAIMKSRKSIKSLLELKPEIANVIRNEEIIKVNPTTVTVGESILVKPGEKIPLDGIIYDGETQLDTSALTGESIPRDYKNGDRVLAGMINLSGLIKVRVDKNFEDSSIFKILEMVENATHKKAKTEKFITSFAKVYTPIVVILAILIAVVPPILFKQSFNESIYRATVLLVISCPCALVLSIPLSYFAGIGRAAKEGILIKGANVFEVIEKTKIIILDKTGTITKGKFEVSKIKIINKNGQEVISENEFLEKLSLVEMNSNHPIAKSVLEFSNRKGISLKYDQVSSHEEVSGQGIIAIIENEKYFAGNEKMMINNGVDYKNDLLIEGTVIHFAINKQYLGYVLLEDVIKDDSRQAIKEFKELGIINIIMLTGDNDSIAKNISDEIGLDKYYSNLLPQDKLNILEQVMLNQNDNSKTVFIGDGINDAPVIARADAGIAMGNLGSDVAIEISDVVIMDDKISKFAEAIKISRKTKLIIIQNIIFILIVKIVFITLGIMGLASMWEAVFSDVGAALIGIFNAMRILKEKL